jgi:hypothetical protein
MVNIFFLALFIYLLEGYREGKIGRRRLYLLPLLTALWANMHSGFMSGVAVLVVYTIGEGLGQLGSRGNRQSDPQPMGWPDITLLAGLTVASLLAAFFNPSTYKQVLFSLGTLGSSASQSNILEWRSPDFHQIYFWFFGAAMALGVLAWVFSPRRPTWTEMLLFMGTAAGGLISARHIPLFAVIAPVILSRHLLAALDGTAVYPLLSGQGQKETRPPTIAQVMNWALLVLVVAVTVLWTAVRLSNNDAAVRARFPVAAVDFLQESGLADTNIYNHYDWGGYLLWRGVPVFIDGRTELYGNEFFLSYLQAFEARESWQEPLEAYDVQTVIMPRNSALATLLTTSPEWQEVYVDEQARIFERIAGSNR